MGRNQGVWLVLSDSLVITLAQQVNPGRSFVNLNEAKPTQTCDQLSGTDIVEKCRMGTAEDGNWRTLGRQQALALADMVGNHLGFLRTAFDTIATADAAITDNLGIIAMNANRLDRAVADTGVTLAAIFFNGNDRSHEMPVEK
jgi:hypothetical protein